ncbi:MAG: hypothetical protein LBQ47_04625 [Endomicrobium sp.]|jgi:hypothetical protein|nr:hypothetical protein [Endomicrobium sp.]
MKSLFSGVFCNQSLDLNILKFEDNVVNGLSLTALKNKLNLKPIGENTDGLFYFEG